LLLNCRLRELVEWMNEQPFSSAGVNFTNVLLAAFTLVDPKSVKRY